MNASRFSTGSPPIPTVSLALIINEMLGRLRAFHEGVDPAPKIIEVLCLLIRWESRSGEITDNDKTMMDVRDHLS